MDEQSTAISKGALWTGRIMSAIPILLMLMSAVMKFAKPPVVVQGFTHLGFSENVVTALGVVEIICVVIYLIPRTAILGAILITGYFGGATAACVRAGDPYYATVIMGVLAWGGLYLRDVRLRKLIPFCN
jgi:hypothetical protein